MNVDALIGLLLCPESYPAPPGEIRVCQTHISVVFLTDQFAYKVKKPVNLGFLDFSTLKKRRHFCDEEVRLNRRLAPQVYRGVVPVKFALLKYVACRPVPAAPPPAAPVPAAAASVRDSSGSSG